MKYYILLYFFFMLCTLSCTQEDKDILPPETMEKLVIDMQYAEAYSTMVGDSTHTNTSKNMDSLAVYYKSILHHYNISEIQLQKSMDWYKRNPEELDSVYASIIPKLSLLESVYENQK